MTVKENTTFCKHLQLHHQLEVSVTLQKQRLHTGPSVVQYSTVGSVNVVNIAHFVQRTKIATLRYQLYKGCKETNGVSGGKIVQ